MAQGLEVLLFLLGDIHVTCIVVVLGINLVIWVCLEFI